jgi:hypothetical protein
MTRYISDAFDIGDGSAAEFHHQTRHINLRLLFNLSFDLAFFVDLARKGLKTRAVGAGRLYMTARMDCVNFFTNVWSAA